MLILPMDQSSYLRLHSQQIEIIAGDCLAGDTPDGITKAQSRLTVSIEAPDVAKSVVSLSDVTERGIRCRQQLPVRPRTEAQLVEILRIVYIKRTQQDRVYYSEDDDVCPDPKRQMPDRT
jgi:methyl coenzyme M reductase subunit C